MVADAHPLNRPVPDDSGRPKLELLNSPLPMWFDRFEGAEWDRTVAGFDGVCQEQLHVFSRARWPATTPDPLVFYRGGRMVGGALVMYRSLPARLGGLAAVKWGPVIADRQSPTAARDYEHMIEELVQRYAVGKGLMLSVLPRSVPSATNTELEHLQARGFKPGPALPFPKRYFVRVEKHELDQRASYGQKWRYHLNRSAHLELVFDRYPPSALPVFHKLYEAMMDRKKFADYSAYHTLSDLMKARTNAVRPELFLVTHDGAPVAGAIIFTAGDTAVYLYGATNDRALPLKAGYFMHHRILNWLRENTKAKWYDLGGTDGVEGLHQFKTGMVGKTGVISTVPAAMYYAHGRWPRLLGTAVYQARDTRARAKRLVDHLRGRTG